MGPNALELIYEGEDVLIEDKQTDRQPDRQKDRETDERDMTVVYVCQSRRRSKDKQNDHQGHQN